MPMPIYTLSYHSRNRLGDLTIDPAKDLMNILEVSKARNSVAGVTGALMFNDDRFVQILEGTKYQVDETFERIRRDSRHAEATILAIQEKPSRRFYDWCMAFVGGSRQARVYYWYFTRQADFRWEKMDNDVLCQLMLNMMDLDRATFLSD